MPDAQGLGTVGKTIALTMEHALDVSNDDVFEIMLCIQESNPRAAMERLKSIAKRNNSMSRTLTFMRADKMAEAQDAIMEVKLRRNSP